MKLTTKLTAIAFALTGAISGAHATALAVSVPTTSVDYSATFFGGTLLDSAITNINNPSYNGIARSAVYDTGTGLDFYYQYTNNISSVHGVQRFTGSDFSALGASPVSVFQTDDVFGIFVKGTEKSETADRGLYGVIGFSFVANGQSKVYPGFTSLTQVIRTSARDYKPGNFGLLNGYGDNAAGFSVAAVSAVPEPESYAMLLAGLGLVGAIARRRKAQKV